MPRDASTHSKTHWNLSIVSFYSSCSAKCWIPVFEYFRHQTADGARLTLISFHSISYAWVNLLQKIKKDTHDTQIVKLARQHCRWAAYRFDSLVSAARRTTFHGRGKNDTSEKLIIFIIYYFVLRRFEWNKMRDNSQRGDIGKLNRCNAFEFQFHWFFVRVNLFICFVLFRRTFCW